jgi:surfeit locus 1 family protein
MNCTGRPLQGRWLPQHSVYLDNRQMKGKPGFYVLTPLVLDGSGRWCWCSGAGCRAILSTATQLPPVQTPAAW